MSNITQIYAKEALKCFSMPHFFRKQDAIFKIKMQPFFGKVTENKVDVITIRRPVRFEATNG